MPFSNKGLYVRQHWNWFFFLKRFFLKNWKIIISGQETWITVSMQSPKSLELKTSYIDSTHTYLPTFTLKNSYFWYTFSSVSIYSNSYFICMQVVSDTYVMSSSLCIQTQSETSLVCSTLWPISAVSSVLFMTLSF